MWLSRLTSYVWMGLMLPHRAHRKAAGIIVLGFVFGHTINDVT